jgi:hypothetical protein
MFGSERVLRKVVAGGRIEGRRRGGIDVLLLLLV